MKMKILLLLLFTGVSAETCIHTDGSAANEVDCTCGNIECTSATGLICYSTNGVGSCRKNDVGAFGYPTTTGYCDDVAGRKPILDKAGCDAAANSLGLGDLSAYVHSASYYPPGCFWDSGRLKYNTDTTSKTSCSTNSDYCLCLSAPNCLETDGTTSNAAPCICGNTGCTSLTGYYCHSTYNQCSTTSITACTKTDGSASSLSACICGSELCNSVTGLICYSTIGGGSCRKNDVGAFGYPRPESGDCNDVDGRRSIPDKATCEAAATSLGLSDLVANEVSNSNYPPGCFWDSGRLKYNTVTTSTKSCSSFSDYCVCRSAPDCLETDGSTSNAAPCLCGKILCTIESGLHCYASDDFCAAGPPCTVTDGSASNEGVCKCGNELCTDEKGLICYSTIGGGTCRNNFPNNCTCPGGTPTVDRLYDGDGATLCETDSTIDCSACDIEYYMDATAAAGLQTCLPGCPENEYHNGSACVPICATDKYRDTDSLQCVDKCPNDSYRDANSLQCVDKCPTGSYRETDSSDCIEAPITPQQLKDKFLERVGCE